MLWYVLERYVFCDLGKSHLTEGVESAPAPPGHLHFTKQVKYYIKKKCMMKIILFGG